MVYTVCYKLKCNNCILLEWGLRIPDLYILVPTFKMKHIALVLPSQIALKCMDVSISVHCATACSVLRMEMAYCFSNFLFWKWWVSSNAFSKYIFFVLSCSHLCHAYRCGVRNGFVQQAELSSFGKYMPMSPSYFPFLAYLYPHAFHIYMTKDEHPTATIFDMNTPYLPQNIKYPYYIGMWISISVSSCIHDIYMKN